jgi:hypothetical protein
MEQNGYIAALLPHVISDGRLVNNLRYDQVRDFAQIGRLEFWIPLFQHSMRLAKTMFAKKAVIPINFRNSNR